jgi:DNA-binding FadR family transcriptional regulator
MAKTPAERAADYRVRRKNEGLVTVSLLIPEGDASLFAQFAAERRQRHCKGQLPVKSARQQWLSMVNVFSSAVADPAPSHGGKTPNGARITRADALVTAMVKRIIDIGWPVGMPLGTEQELMRIHGVSRTVLRQAIRLLEHYSVARMQRGASGGLVVAQPDLGATMRAVNIYLEYAGIAPQDILATRRVLELAVMELAIDRLDAEGEQRLRDQVAAEAKLDGRAGADELLGFHLLLAELCGDPALRLFDGIALQLSNAHSTFHRRSRQDRDAVVNRIKQLHLEIARAIIARDREQARQQLARYIAGIKGWLE